MFHLVLNKKCYNYDSFSENLLSFELNFNTLLFK